MVRVVAILGDYYHPSGRAKESLERALVSSISKEEIQIDYCSHEQIKEKLSLHPDAVILFKENRLNPIEVQEEKWMSEDLAAEITKYVSNGGGFLAWHSGLASFPPENTFTKMLRGHFLYHPEKHQLVHYRSTTENPILAQPISFEVLDEHYFVHCEEDNTNIFLSSESIDGKQAAGWFHTFGEGKVCCLTPCHNRDGLLKQEFVKLLGSCVNWIVSK